MMVRVRRARQGRSDVRLSLSHALAHIGSGVVYDPGHGSREDGVIVDVRDRWVLVRYRGDEHAKATDATNLTLLLACECACQLTDEAKADHRCAAVTS